MKKILVIDDSALMRRVVSDIIGTTKEYTVAYTAANGVEGLAILEAHNDITMVLCDINMPRMGGLDLLEVVKRKNIRVPFVMISSSEDAGDTIAALELGAMEFIKKPERIFGKNNTHFKELLYKALYIASGVKERYDNGTDAQTEPASEAGTVLGTAHEMKHADRCPAVSGSRKLVALCCSTGGPKALQYVIPKLPPNLAAPMLVVQHMPEGFTNTLAARLDGLSEIRVKEAENHELLANGTVYIAKGGTHLALKQEMGQTRIKFDQSPPVVGLKPCGNIMYSSLCGLPYDEIICVILTGMGADGTKGIKELAKHNSIYVIAQNEKSSTVYGMPKSVYECGLTDVVCDIHEIAKEIVRKVGVI